MPYDNDSEEEAEAATAAWVTAAVTAVGIGVAATASKIAGKAAAKKATEEDAGAAEDSADHYISRCISSDEEEDDDATIFSTQKQTVERETDNVIILARREWRRCGGRLVKQSLTQCVTDRLEDGYYFSQCYSPIQKKKMRNIVRKRARDAMSDTSPTLPSSKFRK